MDIIVVLLKCNNQNHKNMKRILHLTLAIIFVAAIIAAIGRSTKEHHLGYTTTMNVDTTEHLIAYDITDCRLDLACAQMPDTADENIIFCAAAAFTGKCLDYFDHSNILGKHISNGVLCNGYEEDKDGIPFAQRYALFIWKGMDEQGNMLEKGFYHLLNDSLLVQAAEHRGMAFTQHWVIKEGEIFTPCIQPLERKEHFRSICKKGERFLVIANKEEIPYQDYLNLLIAYGVEDALYMDMGTGWNHSFYRDEMNQLHILHPKTHSYPTNWIVVLRD